jgi:hypothetical protein
MRAAPVALVYLLISGLSISGRALFGTTIAGFRTTSSIIIGADSREIDGQEVLPDPVCKIYQSGRSQRFWVSAQLWEDLDSGFSVEAVVNRAAHKTASLSDWVGAFDRQIVSELQRTIRIVRSEDPEAFGDRYAGRHILEIVFFGFEQGVPVVFYRDYRTDARGRLQEPEKLHCPGPKCKDSVEHFCLGECAHATAYKKSEQMRSRTLAETIRDEIRAEIKTDWTVGPPIDVLRIDRTGAHWIEREPESRCPPIKNR